MYSRTILDAGVRNDVTARIETLSGNHKALWGTMNVYEMIAHCSLWDEMVLHNKKYPRVWIGRLIGRLILKSALKDEPMPKNAPTIAPLIVHRNTDDIELQKKNWITLIEQYKTFSEPVPPFVHPFFGVMTKEQIGIQAYKHADHHLRQFGC